MKINIGLHVFFTWLTAHLIHPFLFLIVFGMLGGSEAFEMAFFVCLYGMVLSVPALLACMVVVWLIMISPVSSSILAFFLWMLFALGSVVICFIFLTGLSELRREFMFFLPSVLACFIAILVRFNQFERLFISWKTEPIPEETTTGL